MLALKKKKKNHVSSFIAHYSLMISGKYQIKKLTKTYIEPGNPLWSFKAYDHTELAREVFISPKSLSHYKASCDYVIRWYIICIKNASENLCYLWAAYEQGPVFSCGIEAALLSDVIFFTRVSIFISLFILSLSLSMVINTEGKKYDLCNKM